ncbi:MAG: hypothetical protein AB1403_18635, partial [Candidatus Riflebacteria bacterium]
MNKIDVDSRLSQVVDYPVACLGHAPAPGWIILGKPEYSHFQLSKVFAWSSNSSARSSLPSSALSS